jgi:TraB family protein
MRGRLVCSAAMRHTLTTRIVELAALATVVTGLPRARADEPPEIPTEAYTYPGPPLWRVSKGDHELWLLGTLSAVPKDHRFRSAAVESVVGSAQEVLLPPGVSAAPSLKPVTLVRVWRRIREMSRSPSGQPLSAVLPPDLYARYAALRDRYGRRGEDLRPIMAATRLYESATAELGLVSGRDVLRTVERAARRADVEATVTQLHVDPEDLLDQAARVTQEAELDCFAKALEMVEMAERIAARAYSWAAGDMQALRSFAAPDLRRDCLAHPGWPDAFRDALQEANDRWLTAAETALAENRTTFGMLDLRELTGANGLLTRLRERGYEVHEP